MDVKIGQAAVISAVATTEEMQRRLLDLGMTEGCHVLCLFCAPSGNPRAYQVRGSVLAIRNSDAAKIVVTD